MSNFRMLLIAGISCAVCAAVLAVYLLGVSVGKGKVQSRWDAARISQMQSIAEQELKHREQERKWAQSIQSITESLRQEQEATRDELQGTIDNINAGAFRLRRDLAGCRDQLPSDTEATTGDHAAGQLGLSAARQGVVVRIAAECDEVASRLIAAQDYIRRIQGGP